MHIYSLESLKFSWTKTEKNQWVTFISGDKSCLTLVLKFKNHAGFLKSSCVTYQSVFALITYHLKSFIAHPIIEHRTMSLINVSVVLLRFNSPILTDIHSNFCFLFIATIVREERTAFSWPSDSGEVKTLLKQEVFISSVYDFHCLFSFIFKGNS